MLHVPSVNIRPAHPSGKNVRDTGGKIRYKYKVILVCDRYSAYKKLARLANNILQTLALWGINPRHWLTGYLSACADAGASAPRDIDAFLPWSMDEARRAALSRPLSSWALTWQRVRRRSDSRLWNELIQRYHYLGRKPLPGRSYAIPSITRSNPSPCLALVPPSGCAHRVIATSAGATNNAANSSTGSSTTPDF